MAWSGDDYHVFSDLWRVSILIRGLVELILAICLLLCAVVSITTTKLIKAAGLCPPCPSCEARRSESTQGNVKKYHNVKSRDQLSKHRDQVAMNSTCGDCTVPLLQCACTLSRASVLHDSSAGARCNAVSLNKTLDHSQCQRNCFNEAYGRQNQGNSPDDVSCSCNLSEKFEIENTSECRCQTCDTGRAAYLAGATIVPSQGRAQKMKFAKVFPNELPYCSSNKQQLFGDGAALIARKEPSEITDVAFRQQRDCSSGSFQVATIGAPEEENVRNDCLSACDHLRRMLPEDSARHSSQESFSYNRWSALHLRIREDSGVGKGEDKSIDSDILVGGTTPESDGTFASPTEMKVEESPVHDGDQEVGVLELRQALQAEQQVLAALYIELEKERNASSSAANEAMAMISRLQEEKAAVQMEARQFQRMAEERQLYDQEALSILKEILVRRDEEMYVFEEEINLCRRRLLALSMDQLMDNNGKERGGNPVISNDVSLIDRETLLPDGNEVWKSKRASLGAKLLADIEDWLQVLHEKFPSSTLEGLSSPGNLQRLSCATSALSPRNGQKNLLESMSSIGLEGIPIEGAEIEGADTLRTTAAGYESFQEMMESLQQEPSLKDDELLQTLKKVEEKFQKQSRKTLARNGDELRQTWKNILRSFESDGIDITESQTKSNLRAQDPTSAATVDGSGCSNEDGRDTSRAIEEKRLSVLEYVWKFEEQLHQLGNQNPLQLSKPESSVIKDDLLESKAATTEFRVRELGSDRTRQSCPCCDRSNLVKARFCKLATNAGAGSINFEGDCFSVIRHAPPSSGTVTCTEEERFDNENNPDGSSLIHDVYEVQHDVQQPFLKVTSHGGRGTSCSQEIRKSCSSGTYKLVSGEFVDSHGTAHCAEDFITDSRDRLGKLDLIPGYALQDLRANRKESLYQAKLVSHRMSITEHENCEQYHALPESCDPTGIGPSSLPVALRMKAEDVVQKLTLTLQSLETDLQLMQHTISSLRRENSEMKMLKEIAQQLRKLRGREQTPMTTDLWQLEDPTILSSIKGMLSFNRLRHSVQFQLNKLTHLFLGNGEPGACHGDQHWGLCRLLYRSPQGKPIEPARSFKAADPIVNCYYDCPALPLSSLNTLLPQHGWPVDVRERSGTAFSGWDY